jgi:hypothetical protein
MSTPNEEAPQTADSGQAWRTSLLKAAVEVLQGDAQPQPQAGPSAPRTAPRKQTIQATNPLLALLQPESGTSPVQTPQEKKAAPVRRRPPVRRKKPAGPSGVKPQLVGEIIAIKKTRTTRQSVIAFLRLAGLREELQHLLELEERLTKGTMPAMFHAALSTRLLLQGVADHCLPPREGRLQDRFGRCHQVGQENTGNRLAAYVDIRFGKLISDEEHRLFVATLDTVIRWGARGPHRIYNEAEAEDFFLRLLDVLHTIGRAYLGQPAAAAGLPR